MRFLLRTIPIMAIISTVALALAVTSQAAAKSSAAQHFSSTCSMCHAPDGKGYPAIHTPNFTSPKWQASVTNAQITQVITDGVKGTAMQGFGSRLKPAQIHELVLYIRSLNSAKKK